MTILTRTLVALMAAQALLGLVWSGLYRDVAWVRATWFGNDLVTLIVAVPLLLFGHARAARGSDRGMLIALGVVAYALYNSAFYLFGAVLNPFFLIYVALFLLSAVALVNGLAGLDARAVALSFGPTLSARVVGGGLVVIGSGLATTWIAMWAAHVFAGWRPPIEPDAFRLVAALDLTLMAPTLVVGGILLWRRRPWGYVIASIACIQAALYLGVLSLNSVVAIRRGLTASPGELPIWGTLAVVTSALASVLLLNTRGPHKGMSIMAKVLIRSTVVWIAILAVAILNGALRQGVLQPAFGDATAHVLSTLLLSCAVLGMTWLAGGVIGTNRSRDGWRIGAYWVSLTLAFEFLAGHYLFGTPWNVLLADYKITQGRIFPVVLMTTLIAPVLVMWLQRTFGGWGATAAELAQPMSGDSAVADPSYSATLAITVKARPEHIWPWLMQMGYQRGGLYSYDWLDRLFGYLDRPSAKVILREYQRLAIGDEIPMRRGGGFPVTGVEPLRALVLSGKSDGFGWVWQFGLYPIDGKQTRLVSRTRASVRSTFSSWLFMRLLEPAAFLMTRRMLIGIRQRAEMLATKGTGVGRAA